MAGVRIQVDDREVLAALRRLEQAGGDLSTALGVIGEKLLRSHKDRYDTERDPEGRPWAPLSDKTLRRKMLKGVRRGKGGRRSLTGRGGSTKAGAIRALAGAKILVESGHLRDELRYQVLGGTTLELGTSYIYGATHQFGDPDRNIPARPFLGLSAADRRMVLEVIQHHLQRALGG